jgi:RecA-family ATPase
MAFAPKGFEEGKNGKSEEKSEKIVSLRNDPRRRRIGARTGFETDTPPKEKVFPSICKGSVVVLQGAGGEGKGKLTLQTAVLVASGADTMRILETPSWAEGVKEGPVLYISLEDDEEEIRSRQRTIMLETGMMDGRTPEEQEALLSKIEENLHLDFFTGSGVADLLDNEGWLEYLREEAATHRVIFIDTLRRATLADENKGPEMAALITRLESVSARGATIVLVHHTGKEATLNGKADSQMAGRGSSVIPYNTRGTMFLQTMTEEEESDLWRTFTIDKPNFDRHEYVRFGIAKANHGKKWNDIWLRKTSGGALVVAKPLLKRSRDAGAKDPGPLTADDLRMLGASEETAKAAMVRNGTYKGRSVQI